PRVRSTTHAGRARRGERARVKEAVVQVVGAVEQLVAESSILGGLEPDARAFVCAHLEPRVVPGGAVLMEQGEHGDSLYLIAVGRFRVTMTRDDGGEAMIAELGRGELVGELAVLTDEPRSATVTALRDSQVLELTAAS